YPADLAGELAAALQHVDPLRQYGPVRLLLVGLQLRLDPRDLFRIVRLDLVYRLLDPAVVLLARERAVRIDKPERAPRHLVEPPGSPPRHIPALRLTARIEIPIPGAQLGVQAHKVILELGLLRAKEQELLQQVVQLL